VLYLTGVLGVSGWANQAAAQSLVLRWNVPAGCPSRSEMRARISVLLAATEPKNYALTVVAKISGGRRSDYRITLQIDSSAHRAERVLHAASCSELAEAAAWLIALTVDPALSVGQDENTAGTAHGPTAESAGASTAASRSLSSSDASAPNETPTSARSGEASQPGPAATRAQPAEAHDTKHAPQKPMSFATGRSVSADQGPPPVRAAEPPSSAWPRSFRTGATLGMVTGDGAGVQAALAAFVGYGVGVFYTEASLQGSLPREVPLATTGTFRVWTLTTELRECALFGASLRVGPCLGASVVRNAAELQGLPGARDHAYLWAAADAGIQLYWLLPRRVELSLGAAARLPLSPRPRYVVEGLGTVVSTETWSADVRLGVGFALR
jgi:hypothetical protein